MLLPAVSFEKLLRIRCFAHYPRPAVMDVRELRWRVNGDDVDAALFADAGDEPLYVLARFEREPVRAAVAVLFHVAFCGNLDRLRIILFPAARLDGFQARPAASRPAHPALVSGALFVARAPAQPGDAAVAHQHRQRRRGHREINPCRLPLSFDLDACAHSRTVMSDESGARIPAKPGDP